MKFYLIFFFCSIRLAFSSLAQESITEEYQDPDILKIFLDCQTRCDMTYFRQEIGFVSFMQDRQQAEIFMQLVRQNTGGGGREYRLRVQGLGRFEGMTDTLIFYTAPEVADNVIRDEIMSGIKQAVLPFLLKTNLGQYIKYDVTNFSDEPALNSSVRDPWNFWTFRVRANAFTRGESQSTYLELDNNFSANRTTDASKFNFFVGYNFSRNAFDLGNDEKDVFINRSANTRLLYVHSISDHWSIGGTLGAFSSTFRNVYFGYGIDPTIEYNVFPYTESAVHQFTFRYNVGPSYRDYIELTVFDKLEEWFWEQEFEVNFSQIKDWGNFQLELQYRNYLHDFSQMRLGLNPELEWNIARGLNINFFGDISYVANLRNIQKGEVDPTNILLQITQLNTSFNYAMSVGLSYRFGSAYNNIVNTRF